VSESRPLAVGLISHYFTDDNLGCVALSISNVILLDQAAAQAGVALQYRLLVNEKHPDVALGFTESVYEYRRFSSSRQSLRHPLRLLNTKIFDDCDLVANINAGDGFTDLYGFGRVLSESYMTKLAQLKHSPVVMAPQTIGPFEGTLARAIGKHVLNGCSRVFTRDALSTQLCSDMGARGITTEVIDVAFALPYTRPVTPVSSSRHIGINVSGLLYRGGYDGKNYFGLAFDYREFVETLIRRLIEAGCTVHLVPHVLARPGTIEDDYSVSEELHRAYPSTVLPSRFDGPIEAKSYISGLDFFTGARMHATIAALSSGVPVVPFGYSKKLAGLYETLEYPYYIDGRRPNTVTDAVDQLMAWLDDAAVLRQAAAYSGGLASERLGRYRDEMARVLVGVAGSRT